jgi:GT2 family glycosyltransferase
MKISVVVPTLDTKYLTRACVDAVLASSLPEGTEMEVIVVDDGSSDGTGEDLVGRPGVRVLRNERTTGYARAVNRGAGEATGDLLLLLNSDTEVEPVSLARALEAFASEETIGVVGAGLVFPDGTAQWSAGPDPDLLWLFAQASRLPALLGKLPGWRRIRPLHAPRAVDVGWVSGAAMMVRASVWRECGPFDCAYGFYAQDLDFCLRARDKGWRVRLLPDVRVPHHLGATISPDFDGRNGNADLGLLWSDLVLWAGKRKGPAFARRARTALRAGAGLRALGRSLLLPFVPRDRRDEFRAETREAWRARAQLRPAPPRDPSGL